ncbi:MAG: hypothetical protein NC212_06245 [Staphylococcus sp.]|nr:hypothetical protein [Staphylococcus sp.]
MKKQHSSDKTKKNIRPVSEKFYQSINERAIAAANVVGNPLLGVDVMMTIDTYINIGVQPSGRSGEVMLIFTLLKPEIDKAMARSAAARNRRRHRSTETVAETESQSLATSSKEESTPVEEEPYANPPIAPLPVPVQEKTAAPCRFTGNRRERRRQEQEERRRAKRRFINKFRPSVDTRFAK